MAGERRWRRRPPPPPPASSSGGGAGGYSRVVHCNDAAAAAAGAARVVYRGNEVATTKYTVANFVPKSLFEQFRRAANVFFLAVACVSFSPLAPYRAVSILLPLVVVVGATMAKEAVEDWRRKQQVLQTLRIRSCTPNVRPFVEYINLNVIKVELLMNCEFGPASYLRNTA